MAVSHSRVTLFNLVIITTETLRKAAVVELLLQSLSDDDSFMNDFFFRKTIIWRFLIVWSQLCVQSSIGRSPLRESVTEE